MLYLCQEIPVFVCVWCVCALVCLLCMSLIRMCACNLHKLAGWVEINIGETGRKDVKSKRGKRQNEKNIYSQTNIQNMIYYNYMTHS